MLYVKKESDGILQTVQFMATRDRFTMPQPATFECFKRADGELIEYEWGLDETETISLCKKLEDEGFHLSAEHFDPY